MGRGVRLRLAVPMTARRAVMCALWLLEDVDAGACLLAGQLRIVAHPTGSDIKLSFTGRSALAVGSELVRQPQHAARQLLQLIADSIQRPPGLARLRPAPI